MASSQDNISMALFCDFENVALGVRDANYERFDIKRVLERLLLKGSIVVKKAYCDWDRYKAFKGTMHEANFELIEIPHVRQSGKNSADIRLVVDALDLCYTKSHVNTFVIISGDSDFSPLVSKLRENAKHVIGVGVKQSTSDLLIANCDEFIFYDDLVRESQRQAARRDSRDNPQQQGPRRSPEEEKRRRDEMDKRRAKIIDLAVETYEALVTDRDDGGRIWASVLKEALKRRNPGFSESYYGFKTFGNLLEEARARGLLEFGRDEKSGTYVYRAPAGATGAEVPQPGAAAHAAVGSTADEVLDADALEATPGAVNEATAERSPERSAERPASERAQERGRDRGRGRSRGGRDRDRERDRAEALDMAEGAPSALLAPDLPGNAALDAIAASSATEPAPVPAPALFSSPSAPPVPTPTVSTDEPAAAKAEDTSAAGASGRGRGSRKTASRKTSPRTRAGNTAGNTAADIPANAAAAASAADAAVITEETRAAKAPTADIAPEGGDRKPRARRPRKPKDEGSGGAG